MSDLFEVIEDAVTDSETTDTLESTQTDPTPEPTAEVSTEGNVEATETTPEPTPAAATEVPSPTAVKTDFKPDFDKLIGVSQRTSDGRENRIPYSRVTKIVGKAVKDAQTAWEKTHLTPTTARAAEYEAKVKDYETRLERVSQFESVMVNDVEKFLGMLSTLPAYKPFFAKIEAAFAGQPQAQTGQPAAAAAQVEDQMPQPDQTLSDGTTVYSMEGLKALMDWQAKQVENRVTKQVEERYRPIESQWQAEQRRAALIPQVRSQIDEARKWPMFSENEDAIVKALQADPRVSLEGAYRQVVFPRMQADRDKMRAELIRDMKKAPTSTSAPASAAKATPTTAAGPRPLEDVINEQIAKLPGR